VGAKLLLAPPADAASPAARLGAFLRAAGAQDLTAIQVGAEPPLAPGWSFRLGPCLARAFPQALGGEDEARIRALAGPSEAVTYVVDGAVGGQPPGAAARLAQVAQRVERALARRPEAFAVAVIEPADCPVAGKLPWERL
jgi:hypothetical protein